jgi:hypothetical protein
MRRSTIVQILFALAGLLLVTPLVTPPAAAQITNGAPGSRPMASVVDCIRSAADRGLPAGTSPRFASTCFASLWDYRDYDDPANTGATMGNAPPSETALIAFGDTKQSDGTDGPNEYKGDPLATVADVGAVYGLAFSSGGNPAALNGGRTPRLYAAAYTKRVTRFGEWGPGAIYVRNGTTPPTIHGYVYVPDVVPGPEGAPFDFGGPDASGSRGASFPNGGTAANATIWMGGVHSLYEDSVAVAQAGRSSLGDLELDPAERFLYTVNLNNKLVYRFDTWAATPQSTLATLPSIVGALSPCATRGGVANYRPFGLAVTNEHLYLGGVCSAETTQNRNDLGARVDRIRILNGTAVGGWEQVIGMHLPDLDAQRTYATTRNMRWQPWSNSPTCGVNYGSTGFYICPQPMLADIAFDERNAMLLGFRDRFGDITGNEPIGRSIPSGDLVRAPWNGVSWSNPATGAGAELFDDYRTMANESDKTEVASGALAYVPGGQSGGFGGQVITTWLDPYNGTSFGAAWFDAGSAGGPKALQVLYAGGVELRYFGKAAGLGDLELLCTWSAFGDRVWNDTNANGVQDAGEPGMNGVRVQLFAASDTRFATPLATAVTGDLDGDGQGGDYRFYAQPWRSYIVRVDPAQFQAGQPLQSYFVTPGDRGGDDARDSDADQLLRAVTVAPQGDEQHNSTYDIGLVAGLGTGQLGDRVWQDTNGNGLQDAGEPGIGGVALELWACDDLARLSCGPSDSFSRLRSATTSATGAYSFEQLPPSYYKVVLPSLPAGYLLAPANQGASDAADSDLAPGSSGLPPRPVYADTIDRANDIGLVPSVGDIAVTLDGDGQALLGRPASYTARVIGGSAPAQNVTLSVTLPATAQLVEAPGGSRSGNTLSWTIGTLATGATQLYPFTVTYGALGEQRPAARISSAPPDTSPDNNSDDATTLVVSPNIAIGQSAPAAVAPGESFSYRLMVSNRSVQAGGTVPGATLAPAQNVAVVLTLPAGVEYLGFSASAASLAGNSLDAGGRRVLTWSLGTLPASGQEVIDVQVRARTAAPLPTSLVSSATVSSSPTTAADAASDNTASATTTVRYPDLAVEISAPARRGEGSTLGYTVAYRNEGSEQALDAVLSVSLPAAVRLEPGGVSPGGYTLSDGGQTLSWSLGTLAPGANGTVSIPTTVNIGAAASSPLVARAQIGSLTPEQDLGDNAGSAATEIVAPPQPPRVDESTELQLAIHSELDPRSRDTNPANAVYRSAGATVSWPSGEVLDFTPRARITLPSLSVEEAQFYELRARVTGWSIVSYEVEGETIAASGGADSDRDAMGRSGCRGGSTSDAGLDGCAYPYIGGRSAEDPTEPTEEQMRDQAHVYWSASRPRSMRPDVYTFDVAGLPTVGLTLQARVEIEVVSRETGLVVATDGQRREQTFRVRLVAPRSVK